MLREFWFDMGVGLWVRFQKGNYVFVRFCNGVSVCLCIAPPSQRCINNPFHCMCIYVYRVYLCIFVCIWCVCACVFVCASVYLYWYQCKCIYVYASIYVCVFTCGWIYGVAVVQPKTGYLIWRLQCRLQLMVKETLMFQRAKVEIIEVSVILLEIVAWH